jgi:nitroreductase
MIERAGFVAMTRCTAIQLKMLAKVAGAEMHDLDVARLIKARRTTHPRHLLEPGPDEGQFAEIIGAAGYAPDHGCRGPWRFVRFPRSARRALGEAFDLSLLARNAAAPDIDRARARQKAFNAPTLVAAVLKLSGGSDTAVTDLDRTISLGCAIQNMLLLATAQGFGSAITSGRAVQAKPLRSLLRLEGHESVACFLSFGTAAEPEPQRESSLCRALVTDLQDLERVLDADRQNRDGHD